MTYRTAHLQQPSMYTQLVAMWHNRQAWRAVLPLGRIIGSKSAILKHFGGRY